MINSLGHNQLNELGSNTGITSADFNAKNLMITKYSGFYQVTYPITPLLNSSFAAIYGFGVDVLFLMPGLTYSISSNWDLDLIGQLYFIDNNGEFQNAINSVFGRIKWSF